VFGNFLLPEVFPECDYFVYLDNDMFMNIDIVSELFEKVSLTRKEKTTGQIVPTYVGFVFESCAQSSRIRRDQFNNNHPYVRQKGVRHVKPYKYINNGIWIVNATTWRDENVTKGLWDAIELAQTEPIFFRHGVVNRRPDDQHVNFVVQGAKATHLPTHLNIMKNCERHAQSFHGQGIIHLAGEAKVCSARFPVKPKALMTSIVHSLSSVCNISPRLLDDCSSTMKRLKMLNISFEDEGLGEFNFPPSSDFTYLPNSVATEGLL
jgi:lipopolysaccharide biosynthesis glycosyltransferase